MLIYTDSTLQCSSMMFALSAASISSVLPKQSNFLSEINTLLSWCDSSLHLFWEIKGKQVCSYQPLQLSPWLESQNKMLI